MMMMLVVALVHITVVVLVEVRRVTVVMVAVFGPRGYCLTTMDYLSEGGARYGGTAACSNTLVVVVVVVVVVVCRSDHSLPSATVCLREGPGLEELSTELRIRW